METLWLLPSYKGELISTGVKKQYFGEGDYAIFRNYIRLHEQEMNIVRAAYNFFVKTNIQMRESLQVLRLARLTRVKMAV
jgi:hypothetical protein